MNLKGKVIHGTVWMSVSYVVNALIQILRLSILTRFLQPSDFGLIAIITVVLGFTEIFIDMGVSTALFSQNDISKKQSSSLYWISLILGFFMYCILFLSTPIISNFYKMPELNNLIPLLGINLLLGTASKQFRVYKQKDFEFKHIAIIDVLASLASLVIAWLLAYSGWGIYSMIFSILLASAISSILIILTTVKKHPVMFYINIKENRSIYKIGFYQTGSQLLDYFSSQLDVLLIGKIMDTSQLGIYNLFKQIIMKLYSILVSIVSSINIPVLAKLKSDIHKLKVVYLNGLNLVSFISFGVFTVLFLLSKEVILILYGVKYVENYLIMQILCIWAAVALIVNCASQIIVVTGRTDLGFRWTIIRILLNPAFIIVGSKYGLLGIVISQLLFVLLFIPVYYEMIINSIIPIISFREYSLIIFSKGIFAITILTILFLFLFLFKININLLVTFLECLVFIAIYLFINKNLMKGLIK